MKKIRWIILILSFFFLAGCSKQEGEGSYKIYYMNMDVTSIASELYAPEAADDDQEALAEELLLKLSGEPGTATLRQTIPSDLEYSFLISGYIINVDFEGKFYDMTTVEQTLIRAAVVKTLTQIEDCSYVNITVDSEPLVDEEGRIVGSMNEDSFVENPGAQINSKQSTNITLYFADSQDPTKLKKKVENITYTNKSLEKVVMEKLIEGPSEGDGMMRTIPNGTKIITSSIYDGVCYINLNDAFVNDQNNEITEQVVLYSVVNSLCSLADVTKVQITINGESNGKVRYNYELSTMYEMDESILQGENLSTEQIETTEEAAEN